MKRIIVLLTLSVFFFLSCEDSVNSSPDNEYSTANEIEVLESIHTENEIINFDSGTGIIRFNDVGFADESKVEYFRENNPGDSKLESEDYLVIPPTSHTPYGTIKKITSILDEGDVLQVQTVPATLDEIFENSSINETFEVTQEDVDSVYIYTGGSKKLYRDVDLFSLPIDYSDDVIDIEGSVELTLGLDFILDTETEVNVIFDWADSRVEKTHKLNHFQMALRVDNINHLEVDYTGGNSEFSRTFKVAEYHLKTLEADIYGVPVWVTNTVPINLTVTGSLTTDKTITIEFNKNITFRVGFDYENDEASVIKEYYVHEHPLMTVSDFADQIGANVSLEVDLESKLYDVAGPFIGVEGYFDMVMDKVQNSNPPQYNTTKKAGAIGHVGADISFSEIHLFHYDYDFPIHEVTF